MAVVVSHGTCTAEKRGICIIYVQVGGEEKHQHGSKGKAFV